MSNFNKLELAPDETDNEGRHIWLEIVQKLVAVALVAIVSKIEGMMMPVAVTLVMAATSVAVRPYAQPQER